MAGRKSQQAIYFGDQRRVLSKKCFQLAGSTSNLLRKMEGLGTSIRPAEAGQEAALDRPGMVGTLDKI